MALPEEGTKLRQWVDMLLSPAGCSPQESKRLYGYPSSSPGYLRAYAPTWGLKAYVRYDDGSPRYWLRRRGEQPPTGATPL